MADVAKDKEARREGKKIADIELIDHNRFSIVF